MPHMSRSSRYAYSRVVLMVARMEPPGPAFGRPDDKLRVIRGGTRPAALPFPDFASLHPGYAPWALNSADAETALYRRTKSSADYAAACCPPAVSGGADRKGPVKFRAGLPYLALLLRTKIATDDIWSWSPHHVHVQATRKPMQNGSPCRPCCARAPDGRHPASLSAGPGATAARIHRRAGATRQVDLSEELPGLSRLDPRQWRVRRRTAQGWIFPPALGFGRRLGAVRLHECVDAAGSAWATQPAILCRFDGLSPQQQRLCGRHRRTYRRPGRSKQNDNEE